MPLDEGVEHVNRMGKELVGADKNEERIAALVPELNVLMPIEMEHDRATGAANFDPHDTGLPILDADVAWIKRLFQDKIGTTYADVTRDSDINLLTGNRDREGNMPHNKIVDTQRGWREYAREKLDRFGWMQ